MSGELDTLPKITAIFRERLKLDVPSPQTDLLQAGLMDSLTFVEFMTDLSEEPLVLRRSPRTRLSRRGWSYRGFSRCYATVDVSQRTTDPSGDQLPVYRRTGSPLHTGGRSACEGLPVRPAGPVHCR